MRCPHLQEEAAARSQRLRAQRQQPGGGAWAHYPRRRQVTAQPHGRARRLPRLCQHRQQLAVAGPDLQGLQSQQMTGLTGSLVLHENTQSHRLPRLMSEQLHSPQ